MRPIDADALIGEFAERFDEACEQMHTKENKDYWKGYSTGVNWGKNTVADAPTVDAVEVVRWIPVSERLPSKEEYTARTEDGSEYYVRLLVAYKTDIIEYEIGYYDGYKWMTEMPIHLIKNVVAWMLFPNFSQPTK